MEIAVFSWPDYLEGEAQVTEKLFESGLNTFHLRKPNWCEERVTNFITQISPVYHSRIILHQHFSLKQQFPIKGLHFSRYNPINQNQNWLREEDMIFSASIHSLGEYENLPFQPDRIYLSPVYDSISKEGHPKKFSEEDVKNFIACHKEDVAIFALGGVNSYNIYQLKQLGFYGTGILGAIWQLYKLKGAKATCYHFQTLANKVL